MHRDITPKNIFVKYSNQSLKAILIDFGAAVKKGETHLYPYYVTPPEIIQIENGTLKEFPKEVDTFLLGATMLTMINGSVTKLQKYIPKGTSVNLISLIS